MFGAGRTPSAERRPKGGATGAETRTFGRRLRSRRKSVGLTPPLIQSIFLSVFLRLATGVVAFRAFFKNIFLFLSEVKNFFSFFVFYVAILISVKMKKHITSVLIGMLFFGINIFALYSQSGCAYIDAGPDQTVTCSASCATFNANVQIANSTTSYTVQSIPFNPPYPFNTGTPITVGLDDVWSDTLTLPFYFCFFGNTYNKIVVGSNGVISFNIDQANGYCEWSFSDSIPTNDTFLFPMPNSIFGVYHDIDPSVCGNIRYAVLGSYPCRTFVVNYDNICHFDCNSIKSTTQIVLYETTNIIEVYVKDKPTCTAWNSGNAVIGIQNATSTVAYTPPGRNTGPWTASNEAWQFVPNGPVNYTINWYKLPNTTVPIATGTTLNVCPTSTSSYVAQVNFTKCDGGLLTLTDTVTVNVTGNVSAVSATDTIICQGQSVTLTAVGTPAGGTYYWLPGGQTSPTITVSPTASSYYVVSYTANGCTSQDTAWVIVQPDPTPTIGFNSSLCEGDTLFLQAPAGMNSYSWTGPAGFTSSVQNPVIPNITSVNAGNYTLTVVDSVGCSGSTSQNITINPKPSPAISSNSPLCEGNSLQLYASPSGMNSYSWTGPAGFTSSVQNPVIPNAVPANTGTYTLSVTDNNGCSGSVSENIIIYASPDATFAGNDTVCENTTHIYTANTPNLNYEWTVLNGNAIINGINTSNAISVNFSQGGSVLLQLIATNPATGCKDTATKSIIINTRPDPTIFGPASVCQYSSNVLFSANPGYSSYVWSIVQGTANVNGSYSSDTFDLSFGSSGTVTLKLVVSEGAECADSSIHTLRVITKPQFNTFVENACYGEEIKIQARLSAGSGGEFLWFLDEDLTQPVVSDSHFTLADSILLIPNAQEPVYNFYVFYRDTAGTCHSDTQRVSVAPYEKPRIDRIVASPPFYTEIILPDTTVEFLAYVSSLPGNVYTPWQYIWNYGDSTASDTFFNTGAAVHGYPNQDGKYQVLLVVLNPQYQCADTLQIGYVILRKPNTLFVPNAFLPGSGGPNSQWKPVGLNIEQIHVIIYDRWGNLVWETRDANETWQGLDKYGNPVPEGAYVYLVKVRYLNGETEEKAGTVTVIR